MSCGRLARPLYQWIYRRLYHDGTPLTDPDDRRAVPVRRRPGVRSTGDRGKTRRRPTRRRCRRVVRRDRPRINPEAGYRDGFDFSAYRRVRRRNTNRYPRERVLGTTYRLPRYAVNLRYPLTVKRGGDRIESRHGVHADPVIGRWAHRNRARRGKDERDFLIWLIGFFEAEGSFLVWPSSSGRCRTGIEISQKDPRLLSMIARRLGYGTVYSYTKDDGGVYWRYGAYSARQVSMWVHMLNGNLVTVRKRGQYRAWMRRRRTLGMGDPRNRRHRPGPSRRHAWWSGFSEGDVGLSLDNVRAGRSEFKFTMRFYLSQTRAVSLLRSVLTLWRSDVRIQAKSNPRPHHRIEITRSATIATLAQYFRRHPLRGQRRVMMRRWWRLVAWKADGLPVNTANRRRLQLLAEHLNAESGYELRLKRFRKLEAMEAAESGSASDASGVTEARTDQTALRHRPWPWLDRRRARKGS